MLPKTFVIGEPSTRMRVGSFSESTASTETPSLASTTCSANAGAALASRSAVGISSADASLLAGLRIRNLLERLDVDATARVLELREV